MKPLLFSYEMVRAILAGSKTQTRRVFVGDPPREFLPMDYLDGMNDPDSYTPSEVKWQKGDVIWVRENFANRGDGGYIRQADYEPYPNKEWRNECGHVHYGRWKPSLHMPFEACRLFLQVENVRVEQLKNISTEDAIKEGIGIFGNGEYSDYSTPNSACKTAIESFKTLWDGINAKRGYDWDTNRRVYEQRPL